MSVLRPVPWAEHGAGGAHGAEFVPAPTADAHRDGCSCHDVPRELSSCTCFGPDAPTDTTHPDFSAENMARLREAALRNYIDTTPRDGRSPS